MTEQFVSEALKPVTTSFDTLAMSGGEPGFPREFFWRNEKVVVADILRKWHETGPCHHGSGEMYVRKHWFEVATLSHGTMKIYFERQARRPKTARWWLYSVTPEEG